ncbi:MAG TPA: hypothetical protein VF796_16310 [Humisphaera sp.]
MITRPVAGIGEGKIASSAAVGFTPRLQFVPVSQELLVAPE